MRATEREYSAFTSVGDYTGRQGWSVGQYDVGTGRAKNLSCAYHGVNVYVANPTPRSLDTSR